MSILQPLIDFVGRMDAPHHEALNTALKKANEMGWTVEDDDRNGFNVKLRIRHTDGSKAKFDLKLSDAAGSLDIFMASHLQPPQPWEDIKEDLPSATWEDIKNELRNTWQLTCEFASTTWEIATHGSINGKDLVYLDMELGVVVISKHSNGKNQESWVALGIATGDHERYIAALLHGPESGLINEIVIAWNHENRMPAFETVEPLLDIVREA